MNVELDLSGAGDAHIIKNLWPLYQHELSEFDSAQSNRHGLFGVDDSVTTLAELGETQNAWWNHPGSLFPYLIRVDGCPAGFNLVATRPFLPDGLDADFVVHEFFVLHPYRGKGVGEQAAMKGFELHRGRWEIVTYPSHARAISFWRRVVRGYAPNAYSEGEGDHPWGRKFIFKFSENETP